MAVVAHFVLAFDERRGSHLLAYGAYAPVRFAFVVLLSLFFIHTRFALPIVLVELAGILRLKADSTLLRWIHLLVTLSTVEYPLSLFHTLC